MNLQDTKTQLSKIANQVEGHKKLIGAVVDCGRLLMDEDTLHALKDISLKISSDAGSIESLLGEYQRMSVGSKRFIVNKK